MKKNKRYVDATIRLIQMGNTDPSHSEIAEESFGGDVDDELRSVVLGKLKSIKDQISSEYGTVHLVNSDYYVSSTRNCPPEDDIKASHYLPRRGCPAYGIRVSSGHDDMIYKAACRRDIDKSIKAANTVVGKGVQSVHSNLLDVSVFIDIAGPIGKLVKAIDVENNGDEDE